MAKKIAPLLPYTEALLHQFGERLRLARLRRGLSAKQVCERAGMAAMTLRSLERGASGVTMGAYLAVMQVLGIEQDLTLLGKADPLGRELQDARLPSPKTSRTDHMRKPTEAASGDDHMRRAIEAASGDDHMRKATEAASGGAQDTNSSTLADLIAATKKGR